jgi:hypothetical protein
MAVPKGRTHRAQRPVFWLAGNREREAQHVSGDQRQGIRSDVFVIDGVERPQGD